jgi:hypothetical protein
MHATAIFGIVGIDQGPSPPSRCSAMGDGPTKARRGCMSRNSR